MMLNKATRFFAVCLLLAQSTTAGAALPFASGEIPNRNDIPDAFKWKLEDIYTNDAEWEKEYAQLKAKIPTISKFEGTLAQSPEQLLAALKLRDEIGIVLGKLYVYANMRSHEDTANSTYQALASRAATLAVDFSAAASFMTPEILAIPEKTLKKQINSSPAFEEYRFSLMEILRQKAHILSPAEENLLAKAGEMANTPENAFSMLTNADMKFPVIKDEKGNKVELTEERYYSLISSRKRSVREAAFKALFETYGKSKNTLGATFNGMLKTNQFFSEARKYPSDLAAALDGSNIPLSVYHNVVDTVESNLAPLHRYMALRKKAMKLDELHMYDLYNPLVENPYKDIPWETAQEMVVEALKPLGEEYLSQFKEGLSGGWIDVYSNRGKRGGAYSWGSYATHPYILLNYNGEFNDVSTLAHEMGHSMHSFYSHKNQPYVNADYTIFSAEVASTTNEELLLDYMLKNTEDKSKKIYLLNQRLERIRSTVYRQVMFASFERTVHERSAKGEPTTADDLSRIWHDLNVKYFGPEMIVDPLIDMEWARIPHFYSPFYVYQYATGYSAAASLSQKIINEGKPAQDRYLKFLSSGGSDYSIDLLKKAGVDMSTPQPILDAIALFEKTLDEMEALLKQK